MGSFTDWDYDITYQCNRKYGISQRRYNLYILAEKDVALEKTYSECMIDV
jgi:hypothetical protein